MAESEKANSPRELLEVGSFIEPDSATTAISANLLNEELQVKQEEIERLNDQLQKEKNNLEDILKEKSNLNENLKIA